MEVPAAQPLYHLLTLPCSRAGGGGEGSIGEGGPCKREAKGCLEAVGGDMSWAGPVRTPGGTSRGRRRCEGIQGLDRVPEGGSTEHGRSWGCCGASGSGRGCPGGSRAWVLGLQGGLGGWRAV